MTTHEETDGGRARLPLDSDDKLRATLETAHLDVDGDEDQIRRDNFIQIIRSFLSEHVT